MVLVSLMGGLPAQDSVPDSSMVASGVDSAPMQPTAAVPDSEVAPIYESDYLEGGEHRFSLASPYDAVFTHLYYLQDNSWHPDSSSLALNISNPGSEEAQEKAIKLKQFLDGAGYFIDLDAIPRDPNYTDTLTGMHRFVLYPAEPDVFLYKIGRRWVYSGTTVQAIDGLHARVYPFGTMRWLPAWSQKRLFGLQLWQYLGVLLFIVFTYLFHRLLTKVLGSFLEMLLQRFVHREHAVEFFNKVARPISLLALFLVLDKLYPALQFGSAVNRWVVAGFRVMEPVYGMLIGFQLVNLVMAYFENRAASTKSSMDDQLVPVVRNLLKGVVAVATIIVILNSLAIDITAVLGGVAFGTLAFALAAQDTIKNLFGSIVIFLDRPFQIGDFIIIGEHQGTVEEVSVRSTRIRTFNNSVITIPNGNIASAAIDNMGARVYRRLSSRVGLVYDTPPEVIEAFVEGVKEILRVDPGTAPDSIEVHVEALGETGIQVHMQAFLTVQTGPEEKVSKQMVLLAVLEMARFMGIQLLALRPSPGAAMSLQPHEDPSGAIPLTKDPQQAMRTYLEAYKERFSAENRSPRA